MTRANTQHRPPTAPATAAPLRSSGVTGAQGALAGIRVVELAAIGPAPFAAMLLADQGAEVLRIERPGPAGVDEVRHDSVTTRSRTRRLTLDLKQAADREALLGELAQAHILIEGFRPGVMERLHLGPAQCFARNPRLVYGRMTGWGQQGPLAERAGHDINYIALTGALHAIGPAGGKPVPPLNLLGDFGGGSLYLVFGVLAALVRAQATGLGQVVDAAMLDGVHSLMAMIHGRVASGHWRDGERGTNSLDGGRPWYDTYATADGRYMAVGANEPAFYRLLCQGLGLSAEEAAWRDDPARWPDLRRRIAAAFALRTRDEWAAIFEPTDACVSPVLTLAEAATHPHNVARGSLIRERGVLQPAPAPRITPAAS